MGILHSMSLFDLPSLSGPRVVYVGIVGSRRRDTPADYESTLSAFTRVLHDCRRIFTDVEWGVIVVSGGCPEGGDRFAELIAKSHSCHIVIHRPDETKFLSTPTPWRRTKQLLERNTLIARDSKDYLIACVAKDRTGGTEDTIRKYRSLHKREPILC